MTDRELLAARTKELDMNIAAALTAGAINDSASPITAVMKYRQILHELRTTGGAERASKDGK